MSERPAAPSGFSLVAIGGWLLVTRPVVWFLTLFKVGPALGPAGPLLYDWADLASAGPANDAAMSITIGDLSAFACLLLAVTVAAIARYARRSYGTRLARWAVHLVRVDSLGYLAACLVAAALLGANRQWPMAMVLICMVAVEEIPLLMGTTMVLRRRPGAS